MRNAIRHAVPLVLGLLVRLSSTPAQANAGKASADRPHPAAPAEMAQLAFLIGHWRLDTWFLQPDGSKRTVKAEMTARYTLDGFGVEITGRYPSDDGQPDFVSTRTFVYNRRIGKWIGTGINTLGNGKQYEGSAADGKLVIIQSGMLFEGRSGINRITYSDITPAGFTLVHEHSPDDGTTWQAPAFGYTATRVR